MNSKIKVISGIVFLGLAVFVSTLIFGEDEPEARPISVIKYNDYQCPACKVFKQWEDVLLAEADYADLITIEYRHFPLTSIHQNAMLAARAAEAARIQGSFSEMHEKLFEGQSIWASGNAEEIFVSYAEELELDTAKFREDLHSEEVQLTVDRQRSEGNRRLVSSTPTYFIDGQKINSSPLTYSQFKSLIETFVYR